MVAVCPGGDGGSGVRLTGTIVATVSGWGLAVRSLNTVLSGLESSHTDTSSSTIFKLLATSVT